MDTGDIRGSEDSGIGSGVKSILVRKLWREGSGYAYLKQVKCGGEADIFLGVLREVHLFFCII